MGYGKVWLGLVRFGKVRLSEIEHMATVWLGMVRYARVRLGWVEQGLVRWGKVGI